ncbi:MAG: retron system putative HNH endonuclease [Thiotrichaceae bacterium]
MRYLNKSKCCAEFDNWLTLNNPSNWNELPTDVKHALHRHLWHEQQGLCVYCQQRIPEKTVKQSSKEIRSHIEHIRPRSTYPQRIFDHHNLSVSCEGFDCAAQIPLKKEFCEHRKADEYDESQFLNPTALQTIETFFEFDIEGRIFANHLKNEHEQQQAKYMIKILALDHEELNRLRLRTYEEMLRENNNDIEELLDQNCEFLPAYHSMLKFLFSYAS